MTAEWLTAYATLGTLIVIGATALAALRQLRHMQNSNQLTAFTEFFAVMQSQKFSEASALIRSLPTMYKNEEFRRDLIRPESPNFQLLKDYVNYLDYTGMLVKHGMMDERLACDLFYTPATATWSILAPFISSVRANRGVRIWEDFEYLVVKCKDFRRKFPEGTFPKALGYMELPAPWPEASKP